MSTSGRLRAGAAAGLMTIGVIGFVVTLLLTVFVLDRFDAYGEVPIPGTGSLHLPAGEVTVSLHTQVISSPTGGGLPVPPISVSVTPPDGVADPEFEESVGMTTTVNNDTRRRLWRVQVAEAGDYQITTDGQVGAYIAPRLAFGKPAGRPAALWVFPVMFVLGLANLIASRMLAGRRRRPKVQTVGTDADVGDQQFVPDGQAIRIQQLKTITALRDSGALTEAEFAEEKRRILRGH
ncbi:SHOCT domain-containing protein [Mycolicibacter hiberniae]|uniref:SHOCT domain-containing protein n=1 Tax=Mycolicibacter hiberniae TaxID=29314 RepID=UPI0027E31669|nr:SHOCT domain-containing protein [Mycolicibacter hiberniae]